MFDSRVYRLEKNQVTPLYDIVLPNQLPMKKIEDKMGHLDLIRSDYSYAISNIFIIGEIIHFIFSKDGFIHSCYYDMEAEQILFCGPRILAEPRKLLPFFRLYRACIMAIFLRLFLRQRWPIVKKLIPNFSMKILKILAQMIIMWLHFIKLSEVHSGLPAVLAR